MIAIIEKYPTAFNYDSVFNFDYNKYSLVSAKKDKVLVKDIEIDLDEIKEKYEYIILVGAEPCKLVGKITSVTEYQGFLLEDKYLPLVNPMAVKMRPSLEHDFNSSIDSINLTISGDSKRRLVKDFDVIGITTTEDALAHIYMLQEMVDSSKLMYIAWDTETTALYPRDGHVIGISLSYKKEQGAYIDSMCITEEVEKALQQLANTCVAIFHNYKFDKKMIFYHFNITFPKWECTMLMHYVLD